MLSDSMRMVVVASPLLVLFVLGLFVKLPLTDRQVLYLGIPLLVGAFVFATLARRITKHYVEKYGFDKERNPITRASLTKGTFDRDYRIGWMMILVFVSIDYFIARNLWLFLVGGAFGTTFLDWLNDYLVVRRDEPTTIESTRKTPSSRPFVAHAVLSILCIMPHAHFATEPFDFGALTLAITVATAPIQFSLCLKKRTHATRLRLNHRA